MLTVIFGLVVLGFTLFWYFLIYMLNNKFIHNLLERKQTNKLLIKVSIVVVGYLIVYLLFACLGSTNLADSFRSQSIYAMSLLAMFPLVLMPSIWRRYTNKITVRLFYWFGIIYIIFSGLSSVFYLGSNHSLIYMIVSLLAGLLLFILFVLMIMMLLSDPKIEITNKTLQSNMLLRILSAIALLVLLVGYTLSFLANKSYNTNGIDFDTYLIMINFSSASIFVAFTIVFSSILTCMAKSYNSLKHILYAIIGLLIIGAYFLLAWTYTAGFQGQTLENAYSVLNITTNIISFIVYSYLLIFILNKVSLKISWIVIFFVAFIVLPFTTKYMSATYSQAYIIALAMLIIRNGSKYFNTNVESIDSDQDTILTIDKTNDPSDKNKEDEVKQKDDQHISQQSNSFSDISFDQKDDDLNEEILIRPLLISLAVSVLVWVVTFIIGKIYAFFASGAMLAYCSTLGGAGAVYSGEFKCPGMGDGNGDISLYYQHINSIASLVSLIIAFLSFVFLYYVLYKSFNKKDK
ncbi:hypothetical protein [Francisella uliginis]|uniref:Uncharacterized protein n=1 Tax=Francisella uliginis TaxID=573570 RepID=A0A1L4BT38_9GAMM|nr:hypothetical protein [Francisella uliginis]API87016.1 hypothetical protein F7310_06440 [Francisella uliginis]